MLPSRLWTVTLMLGLSASAEADWVWARASAIHPSPVNYPEMAYDSRRGETVLFGGHLWGFKVAFMSRETWTWNGLVWQLRANDGPSARFGHLMAYDSRRGVTVLVGGGSSSSNDTWEWNGSRWREAVVTTPPGAGGAMVYDKRRGVCVLYGRFGTRDTWEYDGLRWRLISNAGPPPRSAFGMAYDSRRGETLLHGGYAYTSAGEPLNETWTWNGAHWTRVDTGNTGPFRIDHNLEFDSRRGVAVLFGGRADRLDITNQNDTWEWNGTRWSRAANATIGRSNYASAYDSRRKRVVVFGGQTGVISGQTFEYDGRDWTQQPEASPCERTGHAMAWDSENDEVVLFGGNRSFNSLGDTWLWKNGGWRQSPAQSPPPRTNAAMAYDPDRREVVMFGGAYVSNTANPVYLSDTWLWNGSEWREVKVAGPAARAGAVMFFDPMRGNTVLVSGYTGSTSYSDAWIWNGQAWQSVSSPPFALGGGAAFDPTRGVGILRTGGPTLAWNGNAWQVIAPTDNLSKGGPLAHVAGETMAFGGGISFQGSTNALLRFDGESWTEVMSGGPGPRSLHNMVAISNGERALTFGGQNSVYFFGTERTYDDTWILSRTK